MDPRIASGGTTRKTGSPSNFSGSSPTEKTGITKLSARIRHNILRIRLVIAGPLLTGLLVLLSGVVLMRIIEIKLSTIGVAQPDIDHITFVLQYTIFTCTVIAAIAGFLLSYVIVKPLRQITETVQNVATGKLTPTLQVPAHVEIDALQDSFNRMVNSLQSYVHERNKYILESLAGALVTLDSEGNITIINTAAESILGGESETFTGQSIFNILPDLPENNRVRTMFQNSLKYHITYSSEEIVLSTFSHKKIPVGMTISPLKSKEDELVGAVATFKDLSKIKQIQQQLHRSDRLAAIGTLATGLAHEIRNPLGSIRGLAQLMTENMKPEDPKLRYAQVIMKEIDRLNHVVQELLTFSQASSGGMEHGDINIILRDALFIAKQNPKNKSHIQILENYDTQIPMIKIEKEKLLQAFLNILINALEAAGELGENEAKVEVRTSLSNAREDHPVPNLGFATIEISNTGKPIPSEYIDRIFDPFFTTKETGTGLGLAISHQIIAAHSGLIEVSTSINEPTVFRIQLPIVKETEESVLATT